MKIFGIILVVVGIIWALVAFNMNIAVTSPSQSFGSGDYAIETPSVTVSNLSLMDRRRNNIMFAGLTILVGAIFIGFGSISQKTEAKSTDFLICPYCGTPVNAEAIVCENCRRDIGITPAERHRHVVLAKAEAAKKRRATYVAANREELSKLCTRLGEGTLDYDQYQQLAKAAGCSLGMVKGLLYREYFIIRGDEMVTFRRIKALRPWFIKNVVPEIKSDA